MPKYPPRETVLVSVRNAEELRLAASFGFLWLDLKEPHRGSLGCPTAETTTEFLAAFREIRAVASPTFSVHARLSIAVGDLEDSTELPLPAACLGRFDMIKVGIREPEALVQQISKIDRWLTNSLVSDRFVLVHYPDLGPERRQRFEQLLALSERLGLSKLLIDTAQKNGRSTFEYYSPTELAEMIANGASAGIDILLAGSLKLSDLAIAHLCGAKIIGIRSAVCYQDSRVATLDPDKLKLLSSAWIEDY